MPECLAKASRCLSTIPQKMICTPSGRVKWARSRASLTAPILVSELFNSKRIRSAPQSILHRPPSFKYSVINQYIQDRYNFCLHDEIANGGVEIAKRLLSQIRKLMISWGFGATPKAYNLPICTHSSKQSQ